MKNYLKLLDKIKTQGVRKPTRAKLASTGEHVHALSLFGEQLRFDLANSFPALTTKRLAFGAVVHELIWFLRGSSNVSYLVENNVHIWDKWCNANGDLGPVYGYLWRHWPGPDNTEVDQIAELIAGIKAVKQDPFASIGRRLMLTAWNPALTDQMALPACHCLSQFSVTEGRLSCQLYQRSADVLLGVPFNIASYALLTCLLAKVTGLVPGEFVHAFGDVHIYENHLDQVNEQLRREPMGLPTLQIADSVDPTLWELHRDQFELVDYHCHPAIKAEVAV